MAHVGLLEDNPRIARLCSTLLHYVGHEVTVYETSKKCLHALLADTKPGESFGSVSSQSTCSHALPIEVLILDLALPDMNGIDVLKHLISHPQTQALPLIVCTAAANAELVKARHVAPHASIVEKPFHLKTLVAAISTALEATVK
jgi:CheY-like chemotaxis protein